MKLSQFNFFNPSPDSIAEYPSKEREESRLMVIDVNTEKIEHRRFKDLIDYFDDGDTVIVNNTKVFPSRLHGHKEKTGAKIELFLLRELDKEQRLWDTLVEPARKIRVGNKLYFGEDNDPLVVEVIDNTTSRGRTVKFLYDGTDEAFTKYIGDIGVMPLPKYIKREPEDEDEERYQTIYAKKIGAVAAPTAGLHFSKHLLKRLEIKGICLEEITLHVGLDTFQSVEVEDLSKHKMYSEQLSIDSDLCNRVNEVKKRKGRICAVGTTVMRGIESSVSTQGFLNPFEGWTNKFIFPPYNFSIANSMVTNFHMPKSTLMMMVSAFAGHDLMKKAYKEAVKKKYRFYSYGDAMFIKK